MRWRSRGVGGLLLAAGFVLGGLLAAPAATASASWGTAVSPALAGSPAAVPAAAGGVPRAVPDILGCTEAPTPELPGRGVVGFFESPPKTPPPAGDPFAENPTTSIYEQYGYAGLRWNTYDLGCGPDLARSPDAAIGTAVSNWIVAMPKAAVAATGAVLNAAFAPTFLGSFDPLIENVVDTLRRTVFEQWAALVIGALGVLLIWRARQASLASAAGAIGWALLVMILVTMVFRWPLVAGHAADETVTGALGAVTGGLNDKVPGAASDAGTEATAGMHEALLYQAWLGGTFGDTNSDVAQKYGPAIFDATALTWAEAEILETDPDAGKEIIEDKKEKFEQTASAIKEADPDAYDYLTGRRSDTRVGYALLAGLATLCAVPFLFVAGLLVLGALIIVRFGVMLFPAFATLGLFPTMRTLVTGVGSTVVAALINALVFGIGAGVTVLGMGVLLSPASATPPWLDVILMLLLTIVMWVALRPFRRLTQMVNSRTNHFAAASSGVSTTARGAARTSTRILTSALGTFLGTSAANRTADVTAEAQAANGVPQRAEAEGSYQPLPETPVKTATGVPVVPATPQPAVAAAAGSVPAGQTAALAGTAAGSMQINAGQVTVVGPASGTPAEGDVHTPAADTGSRVETATVGSGAPVMRVPARAGAVAPVAEPAASIGGGDGADGGRYEFGGGAAGSGYVPRDPNREYSGPVLPAGQDPEWTPATDGAPSRQPTDRGFARPEGAQPDDRIDLDELNEVFRPDTARQQ